MSQNDSSSKIGDEVFEYKSQKYTIYANPKVSETNIKNGIEWFFTGFSDDDYANLKYTWKFNSEQLEKEGYHGLTGYIVTKRTAYPGQPAVRIDIDFIEFGEVVEKTVANFNKSSGADVIFEYYLRPYTKKTTNEVPYELMFAQSEKTDAILVIDGKKMHINKAFLSFHSDFFRALFSSNYKEGQMDEIPIKDVIYEDFASLLSTIYPQKSFPTDENSEKLLELADRFMIPSVIRQVEHHLLNISKINSEKMMWMADKYGMCALLKKTIRQMNSVEKAKKVKASPEYNNLSDKTKAALFERLVQLL